MILRKFMKHVTEQNWYAVGLDVLVVITGIFLGLQVTEWNDQRKQHEEGLYHLETLLTFVEKDIVDNAALQETSKEHMTNTFKAWGILLKYAPEEADLAAYSKNHMSAFYLWGPKNKPTALRRIIDGGKLDLIKSRDIQRAILDFESIYDEAIYQTNTSYSYSREITLTLMNNIKYSDRGIKLSIDQLRESEPIKSSLRAKAIMQRIQLDTLGGIQQANKILQKKLQDYISVRKNTPAS